MPTTQISLVRLHSEIIKPPRALWVPFELGRPLGVPNDPQFQKQVLISALKLLDSPNGPLLVDFPENAPPTKEQPAILACPVDFTQEDVNLSETEELGDAFKKEMRSLRPWYDMAVKKNGRTTVGVSGLDLDTVADFVFSFLEEDMPENPRTDIALPYTLKLAIDDLKAYYYEAVTAQPGQESPSSKALSDWFWGGTMASKVLLAIREICGGSKDTEMRIVARRLVVPTAHGSRAKSD